MNNLKRQLQRKFRVQKAAADKQSANEAFPSPEMLMDNPNLIGLCKVLGKTPTQEQLNAEMIGRLKR